MRKFFRFLLLIYYAFFTVFSIFSAVISFSFFFTPPVPTVSLWTPFDLLIDGLLFLFTFQGIKTNTKKCYLIATAVSLFSYLRTCLYRFFFISNGTFNNIDLNNALLLLTPVPIAIILHITQKHSAKEDTN